MGIGSLSRPVDVFQVAYLVISKDPSEHGTQADRVDRLGFVKRDGEPTTNYSDRAIYGRFR